MVRFIIVIIIIVVILFILRSRSKGNIKINQNKYRAIILTIIALGLLFLIATSGRYILPQIMQLIKVGLPFLTKLANKGCIKTLKEDKNFLSGLNIFKGQVTYKAVADVLGHEYVSPGKVLVN